MRPQPLQYLWGDLIPPVPPRQLLDGGENPLGPPVMNRRNAHAQARREGACGIASISTGHCASSHLPIGPGSPDLIVMANPGDGLCGERSAPATGEPLGIEGLRNGRIGPA